MKRENMVFIHVDYAPTKRNTILLHATAGMSLENTVFREITQTQDKCMNTYMRYLE